MSEAINAPLECDAKGHRSRAGGLMPEDINAPHECDAKGHRSCTPAVDFITESPSSEPHIGLQRFEAGCNWKPAG